MLVLLLVGKEKCQEAWAILLNLLAGNTNCGVEIKILENLVESSCAS